MKKILILLVIIALLLASCFSEDSGSTVSDDTKDFPPLEEPDSPSGPGDAEVKPAEPEEAAPKPESEEEEKSVLEKYETSELLIEKDVGIYNYENSDEGERSFLGYDFDSYKANYEFLNTNAYVSVLVPIEGLAVASLLEDINESNDYVLLDDEDFEFLSEDVYFSVSENIYMWMSKGMIVLIEDSIGYDLLNEYLEDYPVSVIKGTYEDEEVPLDFEGKGDEKIIIFNSNQYVIEIKSYDSDEADVVVNGEEIALEVDDKAVVGNLLIELTSMDYYNKEATITIIREVFEYETFDLGVGDEESFSLDGSHVISLLAVNSDELIALIRLDTVSKEFEVNQVKSMGGLEVMLSDLLINTIGEETANAHILVWE